MDLVIRRAVRLPSLLAAALFAFAAPAGASTFTVRSGNAAAGYDDPLIRMLLLPPAPYCGHGFPTAFTAADFAAASSGHEAVVVYSSIHPTWMQGMSCDPLAAWVGQNLFATSNSVLYAIDLNVPAPCCIAHATLDFCWGADDLLGDAINPAGLYVNGTPIPAVAGGDCNLPSVVNGIDVTSLVQCGTNTLYVYNRDTLCDWSGIIFSATLHIDECSVSVAPSNWGAMKTLYR